MWREPSFRGYFGVARRDITPPPGIYARNWGVAEHDIALGVHRPLTCTVLTIQSAIDNPPLVLAAIDAGWFRGPEGSSLICDCVHRELQLPRGAFMLALSHTHSGPSISPAEHQKPGGHLIRPYVEHIAASIVEAARESLAAAQPAILTLGTGRCGIAAERDLLVADGNRYVCGFNPNGFADDTCLVGRITRERDGAVLATLVNYACHPTTLGSRNRLISPDFVGALRETVERATGGAPCLFLQGASGELAPRLQYGDDPAVADAYGRSLGHAALAVSESLLPPETSLVLDRVLESGAPLAIWQPRSISARRELEALELSVELPLKPTLRDARQIDDDLATCQDRAAQERLHREALVVRTVGSGPTTRRSVCLWRLGDLLFVGQTDEAYSLFQRELRAAFPDHAVVVMNVVNGWGGYLCPAAHYDRRVYQVEQTPYARGALETLLHESIRGLSGMLGSSSRTISSTVEQPIPPRALRPFELSSDSPSTRPDPHHDSPFAREPRR
jgi:hypothetical protein